MTTRMHDDLPWWHGAVIYQIYPRSFQDTTGNGVGDLPGITRRLAYVADLGVDAIWLSPFYPSPNEDWGYDITEHCQVDPIFGTMDDFDSLVERAHELGLKVCIDAVLNHTSDQHPWFLESRAGRDGDKADWYQWHDPKPDGTVPNNWISRYGRSQWSWCPEREQYYRHQYLPSQPALNLANEKVVRERLKFMKKWLDRGVDGLRFDAVPQYHAKADLTDNPPVKPGNDDVSPVGAFNPFAYQLHQNDCNDERVEGFVARLQDEVECAGCTFTFSEIDVRLNAYESLERYTGGDQFNAAYMPEFMEATLLPSTMLRVTESAKAEASLRRLVWTVTNHDAGRLADRWSPKGAGDRTKEEVAKLAGALLACLGGQVSFFQGEELGLPNAPYGLEELRDPQGITFWPKAVGRDPIRHPFPWDGSRGAGFTEVPDEAWLPLKKVVTERHAKGQTDDLGSVLSVWQRLLCLRKRTPSLRYGDMEIVEANDDTGLLHLRREHEGEVVHAVFRLSDAKGEFRVPGGDLLDQSGDGVLAPYGWRIIRSCSRS